MRRKSGFLVGIVIPKGVVALLVTQVELYLFNQREHCSRRRHQRWVFHWRIHFDLQIQRRTLRLFLGVLLRNNSFRSASLFRYLIPELTIALQWKLRVYIWELIDLLAACQINLSEQTLSKHLNTNRNWAFLLLTKRNAFSWSFNLIR